MRAEKLLAGEKVPTSRRNGSTYWPSIFALIILSALQTT